MDDMAVIDNGEIIEDCDEDNESMDMEEYDRRGDESFNKEKTPCSLCGQVVTDKKSLRIHFTRYHPEDTEHYERLFDGETSYECEECPRRYTDKCNLRRHARQVHGAEPFNAEVIQREFPCNMCHRSYSSSNNLSRHIKQNHDEQGNLLIRGKVDPGFRDCRYCDDRFHTDEELRRHVRREHSTRVGNKPPSSSVICPTSRPAPRRSNANSAAHVCKYCKTAVFADPISLLAHIGEVHQLEAPAAAGGEEPVEESVIVDDEAVDDMIDIYCCSDCGSCFNGEAAMRNHFLHDHGIEQVEVDENDKNIVDSTVILNCHKCDLSFLGEDKLQDHFQSVHMQDFYMKSGIYFCNKCHKSYKKFTDLSDHISSTNQDCEFTSVGGASRQSGEGQRKGGEGRRKGGEVRRSGAQRTSSTYTGAVGGARTAGQSTIWLQDDMGRFCCRVCNKAYIDRNSCGRHFRREHILPESLPYACSRCRKRFGSTNMLKRHCEMARGHAPRDYDESLALAGNDVNPPVPVASKSPPSRRRTGPPQKGVYVPEEEDDEEDEEDSESDDPVPELVPGEEGTHLLQLDINSAKDDQGRMHCEICDRAFLKLKPLENHIRNKHLNMKLESGRTYLDVNSIDTSAVSICEYCTRIYIYGKNLDHHIAKAHRDVLGRDDRKMIINCRECGKYFTDMSSHYRESGHDGSVPTEGKRGSGSPHKYVTTWQTKMKDGTRAAIRKKLCSYRNTEIYLDPKSLNRSAFSVKSEASIYGCGICDMAFHTTDKLLQHMSEIHEAETAGGSLTYSCVECGLEFDRDSDLQNHLDRVHGNAYYDDDGGGAEESVLICPSCNSAFTTEAGYDRHVTECPLRDVTSKSAIPGVNYSADGSLVQFDCPYCPKSFYGEVYLEKHKVRFHPAELQTEKRKSQGKVQKSKQQSQSPRKRKPTSSKSYQRSFPNAIPAVVDSDGTSQFKRDLSRHGGVNCSECGVWYPHAAALRRHIKRNHHGDAMVVDKYGNVVPPKPILQQRSARGRFTASTVGGVASRRRRRHDGEDSVAAARLDGERVPLRTGDGYEGYVGPSTSDVVKEESEVEEELEEEVEEEEEEDYDSLEESVDDTGSSRAPRRSSTHGDPEDRNYKCSECEKTFRSQRMCRKHFQVHGGVGYIQKILKEGESQWWGDQGVFGCNICYKTWNTIAGARMHGQMQHRSDVSVINIVTNEVVGTFPYVGHKRNQRIHYPPKQKLPERVKEDNIYACGDCDRRHATSIGCMMHIIKLHDRYRTPVINTLTGQPVTHCTYHRYSSALGCHVNETGDYIDENGSPLGGALDMGGAVEDYEEDYDEDEEEPPPKARKSGGVGVSPARKSAAAYECSRCFETFRDSSDFQHHMATAHRKRRRLSPSPLATGEDLVVGVKDEPAPSPGLEEDVMTSSVIREEEVGAAGASESHVAAPKATTSRSNYLSNLLKCSMCSGMFGDKSGLEAHIRHAHSDTTETKS